mmetsp:Transcript_27852/g.64290  ORF Transcript_27852/g.64290 Transcript_27852/m.64290 type:complete len:283 (-) Transcript_27852:418-1266(-)
MSRPPDTYSLNPPLWDDLGHSILELDGNLSPRHHGHDDPSIGLNASALIARSLKVRHHHIPNSKVRNLLHPCCDLVGDPSLGDVLDDAVVKVQLCLKHGDSQDRGQVCAIALLSATSLEVRLHAVANTPVSDTQHPSKRHCLTDSIRELDTYSAFRLIANHDARVCAYATTTIFTDLEVDVCHISYFNAKVPWLHTLHNPYLWHFLLYAVVEDKLHFLHGHRQDCAHIRLQALRTPSIIHLEVGHNAVSWAEPYDLFHPSTWDCLHHIILKPDTYPSTIKTK